MQAINSAVPTLQSQTRYHTRPHHPELPPIFRHRKFENQGFNWHFPTLPEALIPLRNYEV